MELDREATIDWSEEGGTSPSFSDTDWEERYDILSELYAQRELSPTAEWHQVKMDRAARQRLQTEMAARRQYRAYWLQLIVDKLKILTKWRVK